MATDMASVPGVYWQDVFPTRPPGLLTGVPAFLGVSPRQDGAPIYAPYEPQALHLWPQFLQFYAGTTPGSYMADGVQGFFENGGHDCVICWLEDESETALLKGLTAVEGLDSVDLICAPDAPRSNANGTAADGIDQRWRYQAQLLSHCAKVGDRFAILDAPDADASSIRAAARSLNGANGNDYGAFYGPWLKTIAGKRVPPCGHVAGVYAATDHAEVPRAPANIALEGVVDSTLSRSAQADLARLDDDTSVNSIRSLRGRGVRIWGARTLSEGSEWRYVTVRRLAITIRRWINLNLADVAFEPNDFRLWLRIERQLNGYLESLWQKGHLQGRTAAEAFRVRCDGETNPPEQRELGQVMTHIAIAPSVPNEFIQVRLIHGETGVALAPP